MRILVCIKQISTSDISIDGSGRWINQGGSSAVAISRFDENAIEEAILLKEKLKNSFTSLPSSVKPEKSNKAVSDCEIYVDVISVGKAAAAESIKRAMGMGADNGIHLITKDKGYVSGKVTALRIAAMIRRLNISYDLILTGIMSEDLMQSQVGAMLAEHLNIPCVTSVVNINIDDILASINSNSGFSNNGCNNQNSKSAIRLDHKNIITVERELEGGIRQSVNVKLPALLTIQAGINQPRYPSLSNILRANKKEIKSCDVNELFSDNSSKVFEDIDEPLNIVKLKYPEKRREGRVLNGTTEDKALELMSILKQKGLMI